MKMKTNRTSIITRASLTLTIIASFTLLANAQYKATGDDGITASPKLRVQLDESKGVSNAGTPSGPTSMACAQCKTEVSRRVDWTARGQNKPEVLVANHLCKGCETTISVAGFGKAKHDVATHKCTACGSAELACCTSGQDRTP